MMEGDDSDSQSNDSHSESDSSDVSSVDVPNFLDTEALDSDAESEYRAQEDDDDTGEHPTFHPFGRLPPELRRQIWEFYCPEVTLKSRLLDITVAPPSERHAHAYSWPLGVRPWTARDGRTLDDMTRSMRRLLAVNQESRALGLKAFPDALSLDLGSGDALVHFNKETDVVLLTGYGMDYRDTEKYHLPDFAEHITQLAISATFGYNSTAGDPADLKLAFLRQFPNLKRVFFLLENLQHDTFRNLRWCVPGYTYELFLETIEEAPGLGEDMEMVFCWPNVDDHKMFHEMYQKTYKSLPEDLDHDELLDLGIEFYPMAIFQFDSGIARYKALKQKLLAAPPDFTLDPGSSSEEEESEASEPDEYESDGIDDGTISELDDHSEDENIPDNISAASGSPSGTGSPGQFSSPDSASSPAKASLPNTNGVSHSKTLKRRIVSDSEDEDDQVQGPRAKRARTGRGAVLDSSDEETAASEDHAPSTRKRTRIVVSDSDESDGGVNTSSNGRVRGAVQSSSEEESEEESVDAQSVEQDSEDDDEKPSAQLSLAERLRQYRKDNPVPDSDDENSRTEDGGSDEEVSDDEDDSEGGGLIDDMAGESDEEDDEEDGYDDGW